MMAIKFPSFMSPAAFVSPSRAFFISRLLRLLISHQCYATKTVCSSLNSIQSNPIQFNSIPLRQGMMAAPTSTFVPTN
jgi:hypothetical protein